MNADKPDHPMQANQGDDDEMTTQQVMDELGVSCATLYNWARSGKLVPLPLPAYLDKAPRRYRREDVMRLKREGRRSKTTQD